MKVDYWDHPDATKIPYKEFLRLYHSDAFAKHPEQESFGDGYGEPYNPNRKCGGILKDGRIVWSVKWESEGGAK